MKKADRIDKCQWIDLKKGLTVRLELSWNFMLCVVLWKKKKNRINTKSNRQLKVWYQGDHYRKYCNSRKVQFRIFNDHCSAELQAHFDQKEISNAHRCVRVFLYATTGNPTRNRVTRSWTPCWWRSLQLWQSAFETHYFREWTKNWSVSL